MLLLSQTALVLLTYLCCRSGSASIAALQIGFNAVAVDMSSKQVAACKARLQHLFKFRGKPKIEFCIMRGISSCKVYATS